MKKYNIALFVGALYVCFASKLYAEFVLNDYAKDAILKKQDVTFQKRFDKLIVLLNALEGKPEEEKVRAINTFFNQIEYMTDMKNWSVSDYWANTTELVAKDRGDCEDYVFAKYFALKHSGIDTTKLKTFYVKSLKYNEPHMVLAYYTTAGAEPRILDNYNQLILPASQREDLQPIKFFDTEKLLIAKYKQLGVLGLQPSDASVWLELIQGIRRR